MKNFQLLFESYKSFTFHDINTDYVQIHDKTLN